MIFSGSYPYMPLWLLTLLFFVALMVAREIGIRLRLHRLRLSREPAEATISSKPVDSDGAKEDGFAMTSVMGLLALLIGFTFSLALGRYDERRELVVKEANAIGTTWLRTDLLEPRDGERMREVLRRYVDARVDFANAADAGEEMRQFARTVALQNELWIAMRHGIATFRDTPRASLIVSTTNESIDLAAERYAARQDHIPPRILRMLFIFAILSAGLVGYERYRQRKATALLLLLFSLAVGLVLDLDLPSTGATSVPQDPMLDLQRSLHQAAPTPQPPLVS
ncbi:hypothetical protein [Stenotrophomonas sp. SY1]|uniref:bestrophin-like domain n=1 Tax=Stenotrophomonas sp. SY1 TaxID=477235 RepID=UPI001E53E709|nr:hypothetical protein [Stenotrophomonas sp. SY1]MCD9087016.1 hypothetical protein [Stenotrophomonas sp. SY1]